MEDLPTFRYHPNPLDTQSIEFSYAICLVCDRARGFIYQGPVNATERLSAAVCPWCIADGSAATMFDAEFTDMASIGGGDWDLVPVDVMNEVARRTPGFHGWQPQRWWTHCRDAGEFLGMAGRDELLGEWSAAVPSIRDDAQPKDDGDWPEYLDSLNTEQGPTAYVFRCRHCGQLGGYSDRD